MQESQAMELAGPNQEPDFCWICLDDSPIKQELMSPCKCPRKVHPKCLARWQLQQAGRPEETHCRFCNSTLADWKASLTPELLKPEVEKAQPIMVVYFEGEIHRIPVKQGSAGLKEFTNRIRELFRLPEDVDISLTFGCKEPMSGQHLKLEGIGAFDAAVHCASVAAAERQQKIKSAGGASAESSGDAVASTDDTCRAHSAGGTTPTPAAAHTDMDAEASPQMLHGLSLPEPATSVHSPPGPPWTPHPVPTLLCPPMDASTVSPYAQSAPQPSHAAPNWTSYYNPFLGQQRPMLSPPIRPEEELMLQQHFAQMYQPPHFPQALHHASSYHHHYTRPMQLQQQQQQQEPQAPGTLTFSDEPSPFATPMLHQVPPHVHQYHQHQLPPHLHHLLGSPVSSNQTSPALSEMSSLLSSPPSIPSVASYGLGSLPYCIGSPESFNAAVGGGGNMTMNNNPLAGGGDLDMETSGMYAVGGDAATAAATPSTALDHPDVSTPPTSWRRARRSSSRIGEAPAFEFSPSQPALDGSGNDSVAVGLSGRLKNGMKVMRKFVRSLPFGGRSDEELPQQDNNAAKTQYGSTDQYDLQEPYITAQQFRIQQQEYEDAVAAADAAGIRGISPVANGHNWLHEQYQ